MLRLHAKSRIGSGALDVRAVQYQFHSFVQQQEKYSRGLGFERLKSSEAVPVQVRRFEIGRD